MIFLVVVLFSRTLPAWKSPWMSFLTVNALEKSWNGICKRKVTCRCLGARSGTMTCTMLTSALIQSHANIFASTLWVTAAPQPIYLTSGGTKQSSRQTCTHCIGSTRQRRRCEYTYAQKMRKLLRGLFLIPSFFVPIYVTVNHFLFSTKLHIFPCIAHERQSKTSI